MTLGVSVTQMRILPCTLFCGTLFDTNAATIIPKDKNHLAALWSFCESGEFNREVRQIDQKIGVTNASLTKVPFDLEHWQKVANKKYPNGLPQPQSSDPTQWLFHGHPAKAEQETILQVAVVRLLGYRWPTELDPEIHLADGVGAWVARCNMLKEYADEDGIVCLSATRGEQPAAKRLRSLLAAAFGSDWSPTLERELLAVAGDGKKPAGSLDIWLRDKFFEDHCKLFHHRPIVWHLWDGGRDGFHCLVNAHKLTGPNGEGRRTLESIVYSYLRDWIERQKADQQAGVEGADMRLVVARDLQLQLEKILEGDPPYDLFVRWKSLDKQAVGWEPDINDGVRFNIRPFISAELRAGGRAGAGILRWKPSIKWNKDIGKEPQSLRPKADFPWFWGCKNDGAWGGLTDYTVERTDCVDFDGIRWNDLHYSRAVKEAARATAKSEQRGKGK